MVASWASSAPEATCAYNFSFLIWTLDFSTKFSREGGRSFHLQAVHGDSLLQHCLRTAVKREHRGCAGKASLGRDESSGESNHRQPAKPQPIQTDLSVKSSSQIQSSYVDCVVVLVRKLLYLSFSVPLRTFTLKDWYFRETHDQKIILTTAGSNML